ncbi:MAG: hypothetical protein R6W78_06390 [Bacteroidales bacterium]
MKRLLFPLSLILSLQINAQESIEKPKYGISFSGFIKTDYFFDTREGYSIREGHFLLYPKEKTFDAANNDINAKSSFNFLSIQSRLTGKITGPDAFGAKTSGVLEADFFGNEYANFVDANGFRLRHAFVKLNWEKTELLAGQYWHPFFIPGCFSGVISFNTGAPMQPFSRNPQVRLQHNAGKLSFSGALSAQRDFTSPQGSASLRNSSIPDLAVSVSYNSRNDEKKTEILAGAVAGYKVLQPFITTSKAAKAYITNEKVSGLSVSAFLKLKNEDFTYKIQGVYGQNLFDLIMLGGYVVNAVTDTATNRVTYSTLNNLSGWTEFQTNGERLQFGLWAGYTRNIGSKDSVLYYSNKVDGTDVTTRGSNMKSVFRLAPRVVFIRGRLNFATEIEFTSAAYATKDVSGNLNRDSFGKITESENVSNLRILLAVIYNF